MKFEVITVGQFSMGLVVGFALIAVAAVIGRFLSSKVDEESLVPSVLRGLAVGLVAIVGTVVVGSMIGFGCADPEYYQDHVHGPDEAQESEESGH